MVEFAECKNEPSGSQALAQCNETQSRLQGEAYGRQISGANQAVRDDVNSFSADLANDTHPYGLLKAFYEGMSSQSKNVHLDESRGQLDAFIDYNMNDRVRAVVGIIEQLQGNSETTPDKARQSALTVANSEVAGLNKEVKPHRGESAEQLQRERRNREYEREDFVRIFNGQVPGYSASLENHKIKIKYEAK